jgi:hypothetical protein
MGSNGIHDSVRKLWVMNRDHGLDLSGFKTELEAIDHLVRVALVKRVSKERVRAAVEEALTHLDDPVPGEWGVWRVPTHPQTARWPEHWWGQFWSTVDRVPLGQPKGFEEMDAYAEAARQAKLDPDGGYRYEARPLPVTP